MTDTKTERELLEEILRELKKLNDKNVPPRSWPPSRIGWPRRPTYPRPWRSVVPPPGYWDQPIAIM